MGMVQMGKRLWSVCILLTTLLFMGGCVSSEPIHSSVNTDPISTVSEDSFCGDCGLTGTAELKCSVIGCPELSISLTNTAGRDIASVEFFALFYDAEGKQIDGWEGQSEFYTDGCIGAQASTVLTYQLVGERIKTARLYIYSVSFCDGTVWGNQRAAKAVILSSGMELPVSGEI